MPREIPESDFDNICHLYQTTSKTMKEIAAECGVSKATVTNTLNRRGIPLTRGRLDIDSAALCARYIAGESVLALSKVFGVSRPVISRRLLEAGIDLRSGSAANKIRMGRMSASEKLALTANAHAAVRGVPQTEEHRCKIATCRESKQSNIGHSEIDLINRLQVRGFSITPQKAIGRYNVDIAITEPPIAVEIFGGQWHAHGSHATRFRKRCDYILDHGWAVVIIWATLDYPLKTGAVEYLVTLAEILRSGKP